jgi:hypothetical protein
MRDRKEQPIQVVTANRLADGVVVYLSGDNEWSERIGDSRVASDKTAAEALLAQGERAVVERRVVAPYLIDVEATSQGLVPRAYRERIRALGPSIRLDLGKQAEGKGLTHVSL